MERVEKGKIKTLRKQYTSVVEAYNAFNENIISHYDPTK